MSSRTDWRRVGLAGAAVLAVLGAGVAGLGTEREVWGEGSGERTPPTLLLPSGLVTPETLSTPDRSPVLDLATVTGVGRWLLLALALGVLLAIALWLRSRYAIARVQDVRPELSPVVVAEAEAVPVTDPMREALRTGLTRVDRAADGADAVVQAWLALEAAALATGVPRGLAQTPTEFTVAVLARTGADEAAVAALLRLYLAARFTVRPAPLADDDRAGRAAACLDAIMASWPVPTAAGAG